ncbi:MAG: DUF4160 domain-containing protein [Candidatus Hydrogenedentes bacterium]|nr:DUF4160 domain-containing protein [Candidatus Hydrogenedentota bacterium]MBI3117180.1 DUF4160 domain-containing protein [Candidatus Hydrogenedentota bacterium]
MGKIRRGGYIFVSWKGDHSPRHVHVFKEGLVVKWDLEKGVAMEGHASRRVIELIKRLQKEGQL